MDVGLILSDIVDFANTTLTGFGPFFLVVVGLMAVTLIVGIIRRRR